MPVILAVNPVKKKKRSKAKRKVKARSASAKKTRVIIRRPTVEVTTTMAKRKKARTRSGQFKKASHNPANPRRRRRKARTNPSRARAYLGKTIGGINLTGAMKAALPMLLGALAFKFAGKKWGGEGGAETDNWTAKHYLFGALGGFAAAFATSALFKGTRATAQRVAEGAMLMAAYKIFTLEIAPRQESLNAWFGQDDEALPELPAGGYKGLGAGDILETPQGSYVLGADGEWRPVNDGNRMLGAVSPVDPTMGRLGGLGMVSPVDPTMGQMGSVIDDFKRIYPMARG